MRLYTDNKRKDDGFVQFSAILFWLLPVAQTIDEILYSKWLFFKTSKTGF